MRRLLTFGSRRPRLALVIWVVTTSVLGVIGLNVGSALSSSSLVAPGTESAREAHAFEQQFGHSLSAPILLTGPRAALDAAGPALARRLAALPGSHVVSAWDANSLGQGLRPTSRSGLVLVAVTPLSRNSDRLTERSIADIVKQTVAAPVQARVSGFDAIGVQLQSAALSAVHRAELIAIPVLLIVLLLVFGSPAAAAIPAALGLGTVFAGFGVITLLGSVMPLTELATSAASMMGLALGVDYSLLVVSRFRDEVSDPNNHQDIHRAATVAGLRAGRTVAFAGGAIALLMLCALAVAAGTLLLSAVVGVIIVAGISVISTIVAAPAALTLFGTRVARGGPKQMEPVPTADARRSWITRVGRSPVIVVVSLAALMVVGWQALSLATGPPDARQLPAHSSARHAYDEMVKSVGPGWVTPFEMVVVVPNGAITTLPRLDALAKAQRKIGRDPDVASVIGPGALARRAQPLLHAETTVADTNRQLKRSAQDVTGLGTSLGQAATGAQQVQTGFAQAALAVRSLASGGAGGGNAVATLRAGLAQAVAGSRLTDAGLVQAEQAASRVASGGQAAAEGAKRLAAELSAGGATAAMAGPRLNALEHTLRADAASVNGLVGSVGTLGNGPANASAQLTTAMQELDAMHMGRWDRRYRAVVSAVQAAQSSLAGTPSAGPLADQLRQVSVSEQHAANDVGTLATAVGQLSQSAGQLQVGATSIENGIGALEHGQQALAAGIQKLASTGGALTGGLAALSNGTAALGARLDALQSGAQRLASGLAGEQQQTGRLSSALSSGQRSAKTYAQTSPGHSSLLSTLSQRPGFFGSGYLVLAGLEGTPAAQRAGIDFALNLGRNGQAARLLIVPRSGVGSAKTLALRHRLAVIARSLAAATGGQVLIGGPAAQLRDYAIAASGRMPVLIAVLLLATFLLLVPVFRSLFAPLVGVVLNLLSVAAAFGALSVLSGGSHPLIGGPGYVDALSVSAMFAAVFALSIDYQVFLLMRMREGFLRTGNVAEGVDYGVARTARVVVGAAAIMAGVFLAFATADVATVRQLGIGLAIAIAIDATIVRLVLLPYALRLGGRFTWWLPGWLERRLPAVDIGAERRRAERPRDVAVPDAVPAAPPVLDMPVVAGEPANAF